MLNFACIRGHEYGSFQNLNLKVKVKVTGLRIHDTAIVGFQMLDKDYYYSLD